MQSLNYPPISHHLFYNYHATLIIPGWWYPLRGLSSQQACRRRQAPFAKDWGPRGDACRPPNFRQRKIKIKLCLIITGKTIINQKHINHEMFKKTSPLMVLQLGGFKCLLYHLEVYMHRKTKTCIIYNCITNSIRLLHIIMVE